MAWVENKCGGARFQTLPDFRVEVEGHGFPILEPGTPRYKLLQQTWHNWGPLIRKWSKIRTNECLKQRKDPTKPGCALLPPSNILAIMTQETGHLSGDKAAQAAAGSPAGAEGLMQIMPCSVFNPNTELGKLICGANRKAPNDSVMIGSKLLQTHLGNRGGLPAAASNYNSGNLTCYTGKHEANVFNWHHEQNYAYKVTEYNNTAIAMGVNNAVDIPLWALGLGSVALTGLAIYAARRYRLF
jgi:hypothetical protein